MRSNRIKCPYCGKEQLVYGADFMEDGDEFEYKCTNCNRRFWIDVYSIGLIVSKQIGDNE